MDINFGGTLTGNAGEFDELSDILEVAFSYRKKRFWKAEGHADYIFKIPARVGRVEEIWERLLHDKRVLRRGLWTEEDNFESHSQFPWYGLCVAKDREITVSSTRNYLGRAIVSDVATLSVLIF